MSDSEQKNHSFSFVSDAQPYTNVIPYSYPNQTFQKGNRSFGQPSKSILEGSVVCISVQKVPSKNWGSLKISSV